MQLIDGLYCYVWQGHGNNSNSYVLKYSVNGMPQFTMIDPGHRIVATPLGGLQGGDGIRMYEEPSIETLFQSMAQDRVEASQFGLIINTHGHLDHVESSLMLRKASGAKVALHQGDAPYYEEAIVASYAHDDLARDELYPDLYLDEGVLHLGQPISITLQVLHTPGHSPGSVSLYWKEKRALFTGDTVFYRSVGRTDILGGDSTLLAESVRRLAKLQPTPEYVLTGHPYGHSGVIEGVEEVSRNFDFILTQVIPYC